MTHRSRRAALLAAISFSVVATFPGVAAAQGAKGLVGTWTLVTNVTTDAAGKKDTTFGEKPKGQVTFSPNGRYDLIITRPDLPKFAGNNRLKGTADEKKAVVDGSIAHFGKYTANDKDKTFTFHIESATFPNWNGTEQKRAFSVAGDELKWTNAAASGGGSADLVWKRVK